MRYTCSVNPRNMEFPKHKITEAVCLLRFAPDNEEQDELNFNLVLDYLEKIRPQGFIHEQQRRPTKIIFKATPTGKITTPIQTTGETETVFFNKTERYAIILGRDFISFHSVDHYDGWDMFFPQVVEKYYNIYLQTINRDRTINYVQVIYINKLPIGSDQELATFFKSAPSVRDFGKGTEVAHSSQSNFIIKEDPKVELALKLIMENDLTQKTKEFMFECTCITHNISNKYTWKELADLAHISAVEAFKQSITEEFKKIIQ